MITNKPFTITYWSASDKKQSQETHYGQTNVDIGFQKMAEL